jgi:type III secretory pathway lipoprotein EscJ
MWGRSNHYIRQQLWRRFARAAFFLCACFSTIALSGCRQVLVEELSQQQARECVYELTTHGIKAYFEKVGTRNNVSYQVLVGSTDLDRANTVLIRRDLPRRAGVSPEDLLRTQNPFPSTAALDALRADIILGREAEDAVALIEDIQRVDVVVRLHSLVSATQDRAIGGPSPSVLVLARVKVGGTDAPALVTKIEQVVAKTVPQVPSNGVQVLLEEAPPLDFAIQVPEPEGYCSLLWYIAVVLPAGIGVLGIGIIVLRLKGDPSHSVRGRFDRLARLFSRD